MNSDRWRIYAVGYVNNYMYSKCFPGQAPTDTQNPFQIHHYILSYSTRKKQGPRNLYGRDGKFCHTFESGTEKRLFAVPLLMA